MFELLTLIISGVSVILLILLIVALVKIANIKKRMNTFLEFGSEETIEELLTRYIEKSEFIDSKYEGIVNQINSLTDNLKLCTQKVAIIRYNPFEEVGGDLCFALALLDANNNGVVINGIFAREGSYTYAKPVTNGESSYKLSEEEKAVLAEAVNKI